jgi:hypothetical protein
MNAWQGVGVALVLCGVVLAISAPGKLLERAATPQPSPIVAPDVKPLARRHGSSARAISVQIYEANGIVLGVVTALGQALGTLLAHPAMASVVEPFTGIALRSGRCSSLPDWRFPLPRARATLRSGRVGLAVLPAFVGIALRMSFLLWPRFGRANQRQRRFRPVEHATGPNHRACTASQTVG